MANKIHQFWVEKLETVIRKKKQKEMEKLQERERLSVQINQYVSRGGSRAVTASKIELFVVTVNG